MFEEPLAAGDSYVEKQGWYGRQRELLIRAAFLAVSLLCLFGLANSAFDRLTAPLYDSNSQYLERSLKHAGGWMAGLMAVRMGVSAVESVSVEPLGVGMEIGRVVKPVGDVISDIMELMTFNALLIVFQIAVLEVIKAVSLKYLVGYGALLCAFSPGRHTPIGRLGLGLISIGLVVYIIYPLALNMAAGVFAEHQSGVYIAFTESIGVLKERTSDLYAGLFEAVLSAGKLKEIALEFRGVAYTGAEVLWRGMWGLMTSFAIMFVLTPLMAAGVSYLFVRQIFIWLEMPSGIAAMDSGLSWASRSTGRRTRKRFLSEDSGGQDNDERG